MHTWKVVPISKGQLLDVRSEDLLNDGDFRKCSTYRGGGGYDQFPIVCEKLLEKKYSEQFIVQLFGCNLDCPYCYVTREGVWGKPVEYTTEELVDAFLMSSQETFHLMGGAPALQLKYWPELIKELLIASPSTVFHSDLMLTEGIYDKVVFKQMLPYVYNILLAVNIKGVSEIEYITNTRKTIKWPEFIDNLKVLTRSGVPHYFTFTNVSKKNILTFWSVYQDLFGSQASRLKQEDAFSIDLIDYNALPHVDNVSWGG